MIEEFINNKYTKWYVNIIFKAKSNLRKKNSKEYYELHHIVPKCKPFNGSNKNQNLVLLTAREHFICHLLLTKMCEGYKKNKMMWAFHRLAFSYPSNKKMITSSQYELARKVFIKYLKENHPSKNFEWRKKVSERVTLDWEGNEERRKETSVIFRKSHEERKHKDPEKYYELQQKNSKIGAQKIKEKWSNDDEWVISEKQKMSERSKGKNNPMYGKKIEGNHKEKLSIATSRKRWLYNEHETVYIDKDLVESYMKKGYKHGRKKLQMKGESLND
jgi:hypothetical protein